MSRKKIVITGGSKGIGLAIAKSFAVDNNEIVICSRHEAELKQACQSLIELGAVASYMVADLANKIELTHFADYCLIGTAPDILVNNTGFYLPGETINEAPGNLEQLMQTNVYSAYHLTRALVPGMIKKNSGHIFNICSIAGRQAYQNGGSYSISKFALDGYSKNLRLELQAQNIKVTTVYPGAVFTDSWAGFDNSDGRIMLAEDVATMVVAATKLSKQAVVEEIVMRPQLGDL